MNEYLANVDWVQLFENCDANSAADRLTSVLYQCVQTFVPVKPRLPRRFPPWTNSHLQRLKILKRSALRKYAKHHTNQWKNRYKKINRKYKHLNSKLFKKHQRSIQNRLQYNPKGFWNHVNDQRKECGLPSFVFLDNKVASSLEDMCVLFREKFSVCL